MFSYLKSCSATRYHGTCKSQNVGYFKNKAILNPKKYFDWQFIIIVWYAKQMNKIAEQRFRADVIKRADFIIRSENFKIITDFSTTFSSIRSFSLSHKPKFLTRLWNEINFYGGIKRFYTKY